MKKLLFLLALLPSLSFADRLGSLKANSDVLLTTQTTTNNIQNRAASGTAQTSPSLAYIDSATIQGHNDGSFVLDDALTVGGGLKVIRPDLGGINSTSFEFQPNLGYFIYQDLNSPSFAPGTFLFEDYQGTVESEWIFPSGSVGAKYDLAISSNGSTPTDRHTIIPLSGKQTFYDAQNNPMMEFDPTHNSSFTIAAFLSTVTISGLLKDSSLTAGTSGYFLTSRGSGLGPQWNPSSSGGDAFLHSTQTFSGINSFGHFYLNDTLGAGAPPVDFSLAGVASFYDIWGAYPSAGTNVINEFAITSRGNPASAYGLGTVFVLYGSDFQADRNNYDLLVMARYPTYYGIATGSTGTGTLYPILLSAGASSGGPIGITNPSQLFLNTDGKIGMNTTSPGAQLEIDAQASTNKGLIIKGASSQSADLQQWQDSSANVLDSISAEGRLKIGSGASRAINGSTPYFQVEGTDFEPSRGSFIINKNSAAGSQIIIGKSRGSTMGSNTIVQNGDFIGGMVFNGADGTDMATQAAYIFGLVDGTPGTANIPGKLSFATSSPSVGSPTERMTITTSGVTVTSGTFIGSGAGLTNLPSIGTFAGSLFVGLTSGTTFQSFVPTAAITLKNISVTVDVASVGGSGDTLVCGDASGHSLSVVSANAATAGTLTTVSGSANITAGTTVYMRLDSAAATKPQGNISCGYVTQ